MAFPTMAFPTAGTSPTTVLAAIDTSPTTALPVTAPPTTVLPTVTTALPTTAIPTTEIACHGEAPTTTAWFRFPIVGPSPRKGATAVPLAAETRRARHGAVPRPRPHGGRHAAQPADVDRLAELGQPGTVVPLPRQAPTAPAHARPPAAF
jgi:hypothetical protein